MLLSSSQIYSNLRRAISKGLIAILNQQQLEELALRYFGIKDENGNYIAYQCPYSGKTITNYNDLVLEHIIPVASNGGTVLFNCIPTSSEVNSLSQKSDNHLLEWWINSEYWDSDAPKRLEKIVNYIIDGFETYDKEEVNIINEEGENNKESELADLSTTQEEILKSNKKEYSFENYQIFLMSLIDELGKNNIDVDIYRKKLKQLEEKNIFKEIERYQIIQNSLISIIKEKLSEDDRSELSVVMNINKKSLAESLESFSNDKIYDELLKRINEIEKVLNENDLDISSYFYDVKNLEEFCSLSQNINDIDIEKLLDKINLSTEDKFKKMVDYIEKNNKRPSNGSKNIKIKRIGEFTVFIQFVRKKGGISPKLSKNQLMYLHDSDNSILKDIYKTILYKSIKNNISINYADELMKEKIEEYLERKNKVTTIKEELLLENEYKDYIILEDKFNQFISYVLNNKNNELPSSSNSDKEIKKLGCYKTDILRINNSKKDFVIKLTEEQLKYLHDSDILGLNEIYKNILFKAIQNNIEIEYVDEEMKLKIYEYFEKKEKIKTIEEEIYLEKKYEQYIIINNLFNKFINFVLNNENNELPSAINPNEEIKKLGNFRSGIQNVGNNNFQIQLNKKQLKYLHDLDIPNLNEIYKNILFKAIQNNIEIEYVDEEMKLKMYEYFEKKKNISTLEERMILEKEYKDYIIINNDNMFDKFIYFVLNNENNELPTCSDKNEETRKLGLYRNAIQAIKKSSGNFNSKLTKEQLKYLHDSNILSLNEIYKNILFKAIQNNIEIEYVDEEMKNKIEEYLEKEKNISTLEERIILGNEYKDYINIKYNNMFDKFINYVLNNENNELPSQNDLNEEIKKLGNFRSRIQNVVNNNRFQTQLNKKQLKYLHDSDIPNLNEIYKNILFKAIQNNIEIEYVDEEMKSKMVEYFEKKEKIKAIEKQIELEKVYKDYIIINNDNMFDKFIYYVLNNKNNIFPSIKDTDEETKKLGRYFGRIQTIRKDKGTFYTKIDYEQLKYLHDSNIPSLNKLYNNIMKKAYENNIDDYIKIDQEIKNNDNIRRIA